MQPARSPHPTPLHPTHHRPTPLHGTQLQQEGLSSWPLQPCPIQSKTKCGTQMHETREQQTREQQHSLALPLKAAFRPMDLSMLKNDPMLAQTNSQLASEANQTLEYNTGHFSQLPPREMPSPERLRVIQSRVTHVVDHGIAHPSERVRSMLREMGRSVSPLKQRTSRGPLR